MKYSVGESNLPSTWSYSHRRNVCGCEIARPGAGSPSASNGSALSGMAAGARDDGSSTVKTEA
eukprot:352122-Chlamydomonas_euryale.AAC.16